MIDGEGKPLKVVYWKVAMPAKDIDFCLGDLDEELQWDVLILLDFRLRVVKFTCLA